jgi:OmpA-OmpF porin, OOP family
MQSLNPLRIMTPRIALLAAALLAAGCATQNTAPAGSNLASQNARVNDATIKADQDSFNRLRKRHEDLANAGNPVSGYGMAKAMCWQDVAFHEYTRNDRSAFPELALKESDKLMNLIAAKQSIPQDTPLLNGAKRLREDLWQRAAKLKGDAGYSCVADRVGCAEVRLSHAGHEYVQGASFREEGSWRYATPYIAIAENLLGSAERDVVACRGALPAAPVVAAAAPAAAVVPAPVIVKREMVEVPVVVLFDYNRSDARNIRSFSRESLDRMVARIKSGELKPVRIELVGHADRLNSTGDPKYNDKLSERRTETVKQLLTAAGVAAP